MAESGKPDEKERADGLTERTSDEDTKTAAMPGAPGSTTGAGWQELKESTSDTSHARGSTDEIELEETKAPQDSKQVGGRVAEKEAGDGGSAGGDGVGGIVRGSGEEVVAQGEWRKYKRRWFGLVQLTLLNIIVSWDWLCFSPVSDKAAAYFNASEANVNWLSTAFLFAFVVATPACIYVLHLGPRPSFIVASLLILVGNWIRYTGAHSTDGGMFGVVMFGQILTGLAQPFVLSAPARYSDLWFTNRGRVAATALTSLANPFGAAIGQLVVPFWVNVPSDVPNMVLYVSIISTVCSVPSFFVPAAPPTPVAPSSETPKLSLKESAKILTGHVEFWLVFVPFSVYVGLFNAVSSLLNQILEPYGYDSDNAGIAGAVLIVVGLVSSAITSPILDRTKSFLLAIRIAMPIIGLSYLAFYWMPGTYPSLAGPFVVLAIVGASCFSVVPVAIEFLVEVTHPISPEVTSTIGWGGGQLLGGIMIIIMNALKDGPDGDPPNNMSRALIFTAVLALVVVPLPMCLGLFGRADKVAMRRVHTDQAVLEARRPDAV